MRRIFIYVLACILFSVNVMVHTPIERISKYETLPVPDAGDWAWFGTRMIIQAFTLKGFTKEAWDELPKDLMISEEEHKYYTMLSHC